MQFFEVGPEQFFFRDAKHDVTFYPVVKEVSKFLQLCVGILTGSVVRNDWYTPFHLPSRHIVGQPLRTVSDERNIKVIGIGSFDPIIVSCGLGFRRVRSVTIKPK